MRKTTSLCFFLLLAIYSMGQTTGANAFISIDAVVKKEAETYMKDSFRIGLSVGVYKGGKTFTYNFGHVEKNNEQKPTNRTGYEIGSITKTFTGTLLAQALVDKKVTLEDDIRKYLDGKYPNLEYKGHPIQLHQLINHTSSLPFLLPDQRDLFQQPPDSIPFLITSVQKHYNKKLFLKDLHKVKLDTMPGTKFSYSNAGAQLLGYLLEKVYGTSYESLVKKYITVPQTMPDTKLTYSAKEAAKLAKGYNSKGDLMPYNPAMMGAAGNIKSTVSDMLTYIGFHLNENNPVVKLSHAPTFGDINSFAIGFNWQMNKTKDGYRRIWQSGGSFGFSSYCVVYPELNIGIVLLSNEADRKAQGGLEAAAEKIVEEVRK